jgi:hypothetical protein
MDENLLFQKNWRRAVDGQGRQTGGRAKAETDFACPDAGPAKAETDFACPDAGPAKAETDFACPDAGRAKAETDFACPGDGREEATRIRVRIGSRWPVPPKDRIWSKRFGALHW